MKDPDPNFERRVLLDVVEQMKDPEETWRRQSTMRRAILGAGTIVVGAAFLLALNEIAHPFVSGLLAAAGGSAVGFGVFLEFAQKQWPVTRRHIDMDSVRKRLDELGTPQSPER